MSLFKNILPQLLLLTYACIGLCVIFSYHGTGDAGDSVMHFLFAKYAFKHPTLYFDHWAKPLYVLLASPFAQFGFKGVKIFNLIVALVALHFTYATGVKLKLKNALMALVLAITSAQFFVLCLTGLTEPLFAALLILGIYYLVDGKFGLASMLLSFLPFIRSEGLLLLPVFALYFIWLKRPKLILYLALGHVIYSLSGWVFHDDLLWVFNKIPYATLSSIYGRGDAFHFVNQLYYILGIPVFLLFTVGFLALIYGLVKQPKQHKIEKLILFLFISFFLGHSVFWYFGIFNSMGLKRVLIAIIPITSIIALKGWNLIFETGLGKYKPLRRGVGALVIGVLLIFPFTKNPAAVKWKSALELSAAQEGAKELANFVRKEYNVNKSRFYYAAPYLSVALNIDPFNSEEHLGLDAKKLEGMKAGDLVIWDSWFAKENGVTETFLDNQPKLMRIKSWNIPTKKGEYQYVLYQVKG